MKDMKSAFKLLLEGTYFEEFDDPAAELRKMRVRQGIKLSEIAAECGVSEMTVRNFEAGKTINLMVWRWYYNHYCKEV